MSGTNGVTHHRLTGVVGANWIAGVTVFAQKTTGGVGGRWQMKMILLRRSIHQIKVEMRRHTSIIRRQSLTKKSKKRLFHSRKCLPRMKILKALHRCSRDHGKDHGKDLHGKVGKVPLHPAVANLQKVSRPSQRVTKVVWISGAHVI